MRAVLQENNILRIYRLCYMCVPKIIYPYHAHTTYYGGRCTCTWCIVLVQGIRCRWVNVTGSVPDTWKKHVCKRGFVAALQADVSTPARGGRGCPCGTIRGLPPFSLPRLSHSGELVCTSLKVGHEICCCRSITNDNMAYRVTVRQKS